LRGAGLYVASAGPAAGRRGFRVALRRRRGSARTTLAAEGVVSADWPLKAWGSCGNSPCSPFFWHPDLGAARADADVTQAGVTALRQPANPELDASSSTTNTARRRLALERWCCAADTGPDEQQTRCPRRARRVAGGGCGVRCRQRRLAIAQPRAPSFVDVFAADRETETLRQELLLRREEGAILERRYALGAESVRELQVATARRSEVESLLVQASGRSVRHGLALAEAVGLSAERMAELPLSFAGLARPPGPR